MQYFLTDKKKRWKDYILDPCFILIAFLFGIQKMTNYWDYPIYMVIISTVLIVKNLICSKFEWKEVLKTICSIVELILIQGLITIPFTLDLHISGTEVCFVKQTSPLYKWLILWGLQVLCALIFYKVFIRNYKKSDNKFKTYLAEHKEDVFNIILSIGAIGLIILPEFVYLKDIYGSEYERFNTSFKLTYEAFILFGICVNYSIFSLLISKLKPLIICGIILLIINLSTFGYGINAILVRTQNQKCYSISYSERFLEQNYNEDFKAVQWMKENIDSSKVISEADNVSSSYTITSRMSVYTGNPTVIGWIVHEWLWRCDKDYAMPQELYTRLNDIEDLYKSKDYDKAVNVIKKYNISYVYIGKQEYTNYKGLDAEFLKELGNVVYESKGKDLSYTYIIDVQDLLK